MDIKDKEKLLIKNTGILALGALSSKFVSFFLLPLYTSVLTTADYGNIDVLQTFTSFAMPFVTFQLSSAIFRFIIEKNSEIDQKVIISTGFFIEAINIILFSICICIANYFFHIEYCLLFIIYFSTLAFLEIIQNITRGFGNNGLYSLMSFLLTIISLVFNLIMILGFGMKGDSILISSSLAYLAVSILAISKQNLWKFINIKNFSLLELKEMLKYCLPLIPNAISWWIVNTSDRLIIKIFLGAGANGIYAAANKIPTIYTSIFNVYNIVWIESLSRSIGDKKHNDFINSMFKKSIQLFGCICLGIICCMSIFFQFLIGKQYNESYFHIYILIIAIFINSICSLLGGIFTSYKSSKIIGKTTVIGSIVNILINILCIKYIGLYAASFSTLISYVVIMLIRANKVKNFLIIKWPISYIMQFSIMLIITTIGYILKIDLVNWCILIILVIWSIIVNKDLIKEILSPIVNRLSK